MKREKLSREKIDQLSPAEFHDMAVKQTEYFPDLLKFCDQEEIIDQFYTYYKRKRKKVDET